MNLLVTLNKNFQNVALTIMSLFKNLQQTRTRSNYGLIQTVRNKCPSTRNAKSYSENISFRVRVECTQHIK